MLWSTYVKSVNNMLWLKNKKHISRLLMFIVQLKVWLKCSVNRQTQQPLLAATLERKSLADVIVLRLLMLSDKQSYEPSAAQGNMEEEGRLRDEDKWVLLNRGYWFANVSRRAGENKGSPLENKGVCPLPSPSIDQSLGPIITGAPRSFFSALF